MREQDWETLLYSIQQRNCILLLGPELADDSCEGAALPLNAQLAVRLADDLTNASRLGHDLPAVAQRYVLEFGRNDLESAAVSFYGQHRNDASEIHDLIASIPFYLTITSCHDELLRNALIRKERLHPIVHRYNFRGENEEKIVLGTVKEPLLYNLYGTIDEPESLILTQNDLLDFLVAVISQNPPLPAALRSELQKKAKSFLFLGFGIRHWYLRILLHVLKFNQMESRSFALETLRGQAAADAEQIVLYYKTGYRIEVFYCEIRDFVQELWERCSKAGIPSIVPGTQHGAPTIIAPKIFICYSSEDRPKAESIYHEFRKGGLDAWMDRLMEPGTVWDPAIEERIKGSDYFLVLQSSSFQQKDFGYVNKEIDLALERQRYARPGIRYMIPAQIDNSEGLAELEKFQTAPLRSAEEVLGLISDIKRDYQRRMRQ